MQLNELFDYKNQLMKDLIENENIIRLLNDDCDSKCTPRELIYKQIFPYEFIPDIVEKEQTFICFDVDIQKVLGKTFLMPTLYIWVFSHKTNLSLAEGGVRTDKLCSEIANTLNGSRVYGLGELELSSVKRFSPSIDFNGRVMTFQAQDFNRVTPNKKPIPSNRRNG